MAQIGVIALVPDPWTLTWAPRHHVLSRLARYCHVVWLNPAHEWRAALTPPVVRGRGIHPVGQSPGFAVYSPEPWLPKFYRPQWLSRLTLWRRLARARSALKRHGCRHIVLYLWRPDFVAALDAVSFDLSCYHIDDEYTFSDVELPMTHAETRALRDVDQVFIHSPALLEKKGGLNPHTTFLPNGVEFTAYATPAAEPPDLAPIPHPRVGYSGIVKKQLDWVLLDGLAQRHPQWSFVFVGPRNESLAQPPESFLALHQRPNVHFLGGKDVFQLAAYPQHFDVCIMPYNANAYTRYIYPLKLHEYLAAGRPVVGTRIRSLVDFTDTVSLAESETQWSRAIAEALQPAANSAEQRRKRQTLAQAHDWGLLVAYIAKTFATRLGVAVPAGLREVFDGVSAPPR